MFLTNLAIAVIVLWTLSGMYIMMYIDRFARWRGKPYVFRQSPWFAFAIQFVSYGFFWWVFVAHYWHSVEPLPITERFKRVSLDGDRLRVQM